MPEAMGTAKCSPHCTREGIDGSVMGLVMVGSQWCLLLAGRNSSGDKS